jgi:hypothetical protein
MIHDTYTTSLAICEILSAFNRLCTTFSDTQRKVKTGALNNYGTYTFSQSCEGGGAFLYFHKPLQSQS